MGVGHRVIATGGPGVASRDPAYGVPAAPDAAVNGDRLECIGRAARVIAADLPVQGADQQPVRTEQADQQVLHADDRAIEPSRRSSAVSKSAASTAKDADPAAGLARTTSAAASGNDESRSRTRCLSRRFTRFRVTDPPTALLTTNPTLAWASTATSAGTARCSTRVLVPARRPRRTVCAKDWLEVSRWLRVSTWRPGKSAVTTPGATTGSTVVGTSAQAARRLRPLRRRDARMARPARVRIRRRKPCVLWRRRLFGWNVRLLTRMLSGCRGCVETCSRTGSGRGASLSAGTAHPRRTTSPRSAERVLVVVRGHAAPVDTGSTA